MQHQIGSRPLSLVCIAAPDDSPSLVQWETQLLPLQQAGWLSFWSEQSLRAGDERLEQLIKHLDQADAIILLLSADFFASEECLTLMDHALHHSRDGTGRVIPLLVRSVLWRESPLGTLTCLPTNEIPVLSWERQDEGWYACVLGLQRLLGLSSSRAQQTPASKRDHSDRGRFLRWLARDYQRDLDESLQHLAWLELGLFERPDAVRNATHLLARRPDRSERALPAGTSILDAYDQAEEALLILGDPGAGKSTLLRDLALQLITRVQEDDTHPLPVILPLSSWAVNKPELSEWMVEQLAHIYDVPRKLGRSWINQGQILPLLDGLDEMDEAARPLCIAAINAYRAAHFTAVVVCSRSAEYHAAIVHQRLALQNAVVVQPLTREQIEEVIQQGGEALAALCQALGDSQELLDLATTPLMLSVLVLAYHGTTVNDLPQQQATLEHRIWTDYVKRMVREKGAERQSKSDTPTKIYSLEQTRSWLSWLAQQMQVHNQPLFYGESLLEEWLPASQQQKTRWLVVSLPAMLLGTCVSLLLSFFLISASSPVGLCQIGIIGGFLGWCACANQPQHVSSRAQQAWWRRAFWIQCLYLLRAGGLAILAVGCFGLYGTGYTMSDWALVGIYIGIPLLVTAWLLQMVLLRLAPLPSHFRPTSRWGHWAGWLRTTATRRALWTGLIFSIGGAVTEWLSYSPSDVKPFDLSYVLMTGLAYGWLIYFVTNTLDRQTKTIRLTERVSWTWRILLRFPHVVTSVMIALACFCFCLFGLRTGLNIGPANGLTMGLDYGLRIGLSYWLLLGLYQGITQEHLKDQDRPYFNERIHRSLFNGIFLGLLGAAIIVGISFLTSAIGSELSYTLYIAMYHASAEVSYMWDLGLGDFWLCGLSAWFVLWLATGGLTILRHYTLRLLLARSHTFPLRAQRFLDDACARVLLRRVGGGYGFVHRRLLDYFADTTLLPTDAFEAAHQAPSVPQSVSDSVPGAVSSEIMQD